MFSYPPLNTRYDNTLNVKKNNNLGNLNMNNEVDKMVLYVK